MDDENVYKRMSRAHNTYGDEKAVVRILDVLFELEIMTEELRNTERIQHVISQLVCPVFLLCWSRPSSYDVHLFLVVECKTRYIIYIKID